jgi:hypothetical protein
LNIKNFKSHCTICTGVRNDNGIKYKIILHNILLPTT